MKNTTRITTLFMVLIIFSCSPDYLEEDIEVTTVSDPSLYKKGKNNNNNGKKNALLKWDFDDLTGWEDATQVGLPDYFVENGLLNISTNANSWDRKKIKTTSTFTTGTYTWKIYVPEMGVGDMASIGAFLYNNDTHELDFEVGYGKQIIREELNAEADDLLVYMNSQANPSETHITKIKREQWHTFTIVLTLNSSRDYHVSWIINDVQAAQTRLYYGSRHKFKIFCSLENLTFIGDHVPYTKNYALFDYVEYSNN